MEKFFLNLYDLRFDIRFADALLFDAGQDLLLRIKVCSRIRKNCLEQRFTDKPALVYSPPPEDVNDEKEKQEVKNLAEPTAKRQTPTFSAEEIVPILRESKDTPKGDRDDIEILLHHDPSTPLKSVASILEGFIDDPLFKENDDLFNLECKTNDWKRILYDTLIDKAECFDPGGDNDENRMLFLATEFHTYIEEDHVTFSPKSDPLHHEFTGELIMIPSGIVREHEDYINRMSLLCGNSSSQSSEIIESIPSSTTLVEDSDSNREEIDIFSKPDDSIPIPRD
ncbi:hypothetical protein Tco_1001994 [Tanacetum coccineum]|uniref:Reverse transcriptase domain-containing protein n=1 Tax=Tanacetum coccineum TaxID=301880 RepID=A0ABQ5F520_9ASTR